MSLLDDASRLASHELRDHDDVGGYGFCPLCDEPEGHRSGCPWLAMPRIVAALEAAEAYIHTGPSEHWCPICLRAIRYGGEPHADGCEFAALASALKSDED